MHRLRLNKYQKAMQLVLDLRGPEEMNRIVRHAVLEARSTPVTTPVLDTSTCEALEADLDGWSLPPGVEAFGKLIAAYPETFQKPILTTNFDPLIKIATGRAGRQSEAIFLSSDGRFDNIYGTNAARVVHLHGYWFGTDTLHTPQQLTRERPRLKGCLRDLLRDTTLVVMGYGGWDDVITRTLFDAVAEGSDRLDVLWCFYPDSEVIIRQENATLLKAIEHLAGQRIVLYKGVDCHALLPALLKQANERVSGAVTIPVSSRSEEGTSLRVHKNLPQSESFRCDPPPVIDVWVGRQRELSILRDPSVKVATIAAIGGQGKSVLRPNLSKNRRSHRSLNCGTGGTVESRGIRSTRNSCRWSSGSHREACARLSLPESPWTRWFRRCLRILDIVAFCLYLTISITTSI